MSERVLRIGLPKGSLQEATIEIFRKAGFPISVDERQYKPDFGDDELWGVLLRAQEMPDYVANGILDCGLTGLDWIRERGVEDEVIEVVDLVYAKRGMRPYKWVLAVHESSDIQSPEDLEGKRIATELVDVTTKYLAEHGVEAQVEFSWGATEAKCPSLVDAIVEGTETGSTLAANNLRIVDVLFESCTKFIANKAAWDDPWKGKTIEEIGTQLGGVMEADLKVGLKMNVARDNIEAVIAHLAPKNGHALDSPTVSPLARGDWVAVDTIVDSALVRELIPKLRAVGARGIVEYPLTKVIV